MHFATLIFRRNRSCSASDSACTYISP